MEAPKNFVYGIVSIPCNFERNQSTFKNSSLFLLCTFLEFSKKLERLRLFDIPEYPCLICDKQFEKLLELRLHRNLFHEGKRVKCPTCNTLFSKSRALNMHISSVHEGVKFDCLLCESKFSQKISLKRHVEAVHEKQKKHKCFICNFDFYGKQEMRIHMETRHEGRRDQKCSQCNKGQSINYVVIFDCF